MLAVCPFRFRQFGPDPRSGVHFRLITDPEWLDCFHIDGGGMYGGTDIVVRDSLEGIHAAIREAPRPCHALVISTGNLMVSPPRTLLGDSCKLLVIPAHSTPLDPDDIAHFLDATEHADPGMQKAWADRFFDIGGRSRHLLFVDRRTGTQARFEHRAGHCEWFDQVGEIPWGGQQFAPPGEISCLPMAHGRFDPGRRFALDGEVTFQGIPIVNSGRPSFLRSDQQRIHDALASLVDHAVVARIEAGIVVDHRPLAPGGQPAAAMLDALFDVDSRFRQVWELGFGANTQMQPRPGNKAPNEAFGASNGCLHFGLGLTPWTQYHIDLLSPETQVCNELGEVLAGPHASTAERP